MNTNQVVDQASAWIKRITLICLLLLAASMIVKAALGLFGITAPWRSPPLDQTTGIALAALAYVLK